MVVAVVISPAGIVSELTIPIKTSDVLDWIRKKYKNPRIQFQGKLQDPLNQQRWLTIFAEVSEDDENVNQHMLPSPLDEDTFVGNIIILADEHEGEDDYTKSASDYVNLKPDDYETLYGEWSFNLEEDEEVQEADEDDDEAEEIVDDESEVTVEVKRQTIVKQATRTKDVFVECPIREKVITNYVELGLSHELAERLEHHTLQYVVNLAKQCSVDVDWTNRVFWNSYRSRAIVIYENLLNGWLSKLVNKEVTPDTFAEMTIIQMNPGKWEPILTKISEHETKLYSSQKTASIILDCKRCHKKTNCDYYQLQTRSADEPMTTFVTCLECDYKWKF